MKKISRFMLAALTLTAAPFTLNAAEMTPYTEMPAGVYEVDKAHASITWKVMHMGLAKYTARFTKFDADLNYNPTEPTQSTLKVTIDPTSIETDYPNPEKEDFNAKLATNEDWFNAGEFPEITFTSTAIEMTGENTGKVTGDLAMLGVTKPVTLDVTFNGAYAEKPMSAVPAMGFSGHTTIKRSDWGFGTYVPMIGDEVEILVEAEFEQPKADAESAE